MTGTSRSATGRAAKARATGRRAYAAPALVDYGTIADLTGHRRHKEWGPGDFFWIFRPRSGGEGGPGPGGGLS